MKIKEDAPPSCKHKIELPKELEKFDDIVERIGIKEVTDRWVHTDANNFKLLIEAVKVDEIKKIGASLKPEHIQNMKKMIDFISNEKISKNNPVAIAKIFSAIGSLGDEKIYSKFDFKTLKKLNEIINSFGGYETIIEFIPRLKSEHLKKLLEKLKFFAS